MKIHKEPSKNQQRILQAVFELLHAQGLIWVPQRAEEAVRILGDVDLAPSDGRRLAAALAGLPEVPASGPFFCQDVSSTSWGANFRSVKSLLALHGPQQGSPGWVMVVNKLASPAAHGQNPGGSSGFGRTEAAVLTPFVALLDLQSRSSDRYLELKELLVGLTRSLTAALDAKDSYTYGHSERVARIAIELARELGMKGDDLGDIYLAGLLHDVGKIGVRDGVFRKPSALSAEEFEEVKQHVTIGYKILSDLRPIRSLLPGVLYHHERFDGSGYPDGLQGEAIPLLARILAVADAYDAMSTARPYRDAFPCRRVEEILTKGAGTQWDKRVIEAFQRCRQKIHAIRQRGVGDSLSRALDGALRTEAPSSLFPVGPV